MKGGRHGERDHDDSLYSSMSRQFHASTLCYAKLSQSTIVIITERPLRRIPGRRDGMWTGSKKHFLCPQGRVALSCGRVAHGGRTNASCSPFAQ